MSLWLGTVSTSPRLTESQTHYSELAVVRYGHTPASVPLTLPGSQRFKAPSHLFSPEAYIWFAVPLRLRYKQKGIELAKKLVATGMRPCTSLHLCASLLSGPVTGLLCPKGPPKESRLPVPTAEKGSEKVGDPLVKSHPPEKSHTKRTRRPSVFPRLPGEGPAPAPSVSLVNPGSRHAGFHDKCWLWRGHPCANWPVAP